MLTEPHKPAVTFQRCPVPLCGWTCSQTAAGSYPFGAHNRIAETCQLGKAAEPLGTASRASPVRFICALRTLAVTIQRQQPCAGRVPLLPPCCWTPCWSCCAAASHASPSCWCRLLQGVSQAAGTPRTRQVAVRLTRARFTARRHRPCAGCAQPEPLPYRSTPLPRSRRCLAAHEVLLLPPLLQGISGAARVLRSQFGTIPLPTRDTSQPGSIDHVLAAHSTSRCLAARHLCDAAAGPHPKRLLLPLSPEGVL